MPKKKIDTRLQALFASFEHPDADAAQEQAELEAVRTRLLELETQFPEREMPAPTPERTRPAVVEVTESKSLPAQPVIYEKEQVGYAFTGSSLEIFRGSELKGLDPSSVIRTPLTETGKSVGAMVVEPDPTHPWTQEEQSLTEAIAQQASLQIQNLRLLAAAERARAEAQAATRQFTHESWDSYLDGIRQNERIGYAYDLNSVEPCIDASPADIDYQESVSVLDEQVGKMLLKTNQNQPLTEDDRALISAVANQIGQQVENLRLLADAARARAEAEEASRRLTRASWQDYVGKNEDIALTYVYDQNQVSLVDVAPTDISHSRPLVIRGEPIGELAVTGLENISPESAGLLAEVATQTSIHLETLRLNEELRKRAAELQELDRLKSSFLANMSHELRTPLNSILGFSDVMLEGIDGPLTDYMENDLRLIQKNGLHLLHLINDVLDMAKIESGRMNLHPELFKINDLFEEVLSITSALAGERNLELLVQPDSSLEIEIIADVTRLRQVMINLVNNSIKFTEKGSVSLRADMIANDQIMISVKDTGIGIPPDQLETIFQEFSQVDTSTTRKAGGTGLGLPISRKLVELHGGRMWAESTNIPGEGSVFYVVLPREVVISENIEIISR